MSEQSQRPKTAHEIRRAFLDFFAARDHRVVKSYALIPPDDPTLYFVNAGMVQFKDLFVGARPVEYPRAVSCQRCLRVSGKHNDLENVGRTPRHHTLFEMLGNFSFGDYFKEGAVRMAWEFLTGVLGVPAEKLHVSVHPDDSEAYSLWSDEIGVPEARIHRDPQNFWAMGDTGPCGPCSEIHIDLGPEMSGGVELPYGDPAADNRYLELWNLVFMQYERSEDGTLTPLPKPSIDTGMGLERITAVLQGHTSNYGTDLFMPIMERVAARAGVKYGADERTDTALRVIADHSRAAAFLIADGIYPDNEGRGYVLRRIMRRAIRFGRILGIEEPFLVDTTAHVIERMGDVYPELSDGRETVHRIVLEEEKRFGRTINAGIKRLDEEIGRLRASGESVLDGRVAFELYDTHGFPPDLTALILEDHDLRFSQEGFDTAMNEQRERARAASRFGTGDLSAYQALVESGLSTTFVGYDSGVADSAIAALLVEGQRVPQAATGQRVEIVVRRTPFYAESGGQIGDVGVITGAGEPPVRVRIEDTQRPFGDLVVHVGTVEQGTLREGVEVRLEVDADARLSTRKHHSATHLLHHALREVLGPHVRQRGSWVGPHRLRFDFSHSGAMTPEEIARVDLMVNELILANEPVHTDLLPFDEAIARGAIAFFEEKYGDTVRMLRVGGHSTELCGGTHVRATGDIGLFKIVNEQAISSGVRRVEGVVGMDAVRWVQARDAMLRATAERLNVSAEQIVGRVEKLLEDRKALAQELESARTAAQVARVSSELSHARQIGEYRVAALRLDGVPGRDLRSVGEDLRSRIGSGALLLVAVDGDKVSLLVAATPEVSGRLPAGKLVGQLAPLVGGRGGGRPDLAQAGGTEVGGVDEAVRAFYAAAEAALAG
ncbi:MAG: alanine--tRNA ligase [Deltaproteobacteria bacterium]|nr:alanine--tRNA ligase [Deltaproteobacteria bacterium]MCB9786031.1 alanine--tRNA ligase [Deltaproteobacteria bacterium]